MPRAHVHPDHKVELEYEIFRPLPLDGEPFPPSKGTVLCVMGLGAQLVAWPREEFIDKLVQEGFTVIRFDNRDIGKSTILQHHGAPNIPWAYVKRLFKSRVTAPYTLIDMAQDCVGLLDHLGVQKAHVIGVSMGGMISQELAILAPERVATLTSIMSSTGDPSLPSPSFTVSLQLIKKPPEEEDARARRAVELFGIIGSKKYYTDEQKQHVEMVSRSSFKRNPDGSGASRQLMAIIAQEPRTERLKSVSCPAMVVHGQEDPLVPFAHGVATAEAIPGASLIPIKEMGHDLCLQHLPEIIENLLALFEKAESTPPTKNVGEEGETSEEKKEEETDRKGKKVKKGKDKKEKEGKEKKAKGEEKQIKGKKDTRQVNVEEEKHQKTEEEEVEAEDEADGKQGKIVEKEEVEANEQDERHDEEFVSNSGAGARKQEENESIVEKESENEQEVNSDADAELAKEGDIGNAHKTDNEEDES